MTIAPTTPPPRKNVNVLHDGRSVPALHPVTVSTICANPTPIMPPPKKLPGNNRHPIARRGGPVRSLPTSVCRELARHRHDVRRLWQHEILERR